MGSNEQPKSRGGRHRTTLTFRTSRFHHPTILIIRGGNVIVASWHFRLWVAWARVPQAFRFRAAKHGGFAMSIPLRGRASSRLWSWRLRPRPFPPRHRSCPRRLLSWELSGATEVPPDLPEFLPGMELPSTDCSRPLSSRCREPRHLTGSLMSRSRSFPAHLSPSIPVERLSRRVDVHVWWIALLSTETHRRLERAPFAAGLARSAA